MTTKKQQLLEQLQQGRDLFISILRDKLTEEKPWILVMFYHDYETEPETRYYLLTEQEKQQIVEECGKQTNKYNYSLYQSMLDRIYLTKIFNEVRCFYASEITDISENISSFELELEQGSLISKDKILEPKELIFREKGKSIKTALYSYHYEEKGLQCQQL